MSTRLVFYIVNAVYPTYPDQWRVRIKTTLVVTYNQKVQEVCLLWPDHKSRCRNTSRHHARLHINLNCLGPGKALRVEWQFLPEATASRIIQEYEISPTTIRDPRFTTSSQHSLPSIPTTPLLGCSLFLYSPRVGRSVTVTQYSMTRKNDEKDCGVAAAIANAPH